MDQKLIKAITLLEIGQNLIIGDINVDLIDMLSQEEFAGAEDSLKWAARTYVVAALGALASLLYWAVRILGSRD